MDHEAVLEAERDDKMIAGGATMVVGRVEAEMFADDRIAGLSVPRKRWSERQAADIVPIKRRFDDDNAPRVFHHGIVD